MGFLQLRKCFVHHFSVINCKTIYQLCPNYSSLLGQKTTLTISNHAGQKSFCFARRRFYYNTASTYQHIAIIDNYFTLGKDRQEGEEYSQITNLRVNVYKYESNMFKERTLYKHYFMLVFKSLLFYSLHIIVVSHWF